jgi:hypothetical protein
MYISAPDRTAEAFEQKPVRLHYGPVSEIRLIAMPPEFCLT